jgi:hypothetical protein
MTFFENGRDRKKAEIQMADTFKVSDINAGSVETRFIASPSGLKFEKRDKHRRNETVRCIVTEIATVA